jgi:hypothetical protein
LREIAMFRGVGRERFSACIDKRWRAEYNPPRLGPVWRGQAWNRREVLFFEVCIWRTDFAPARRWAPGWWSIRGRFPIRPSEGSCTLPAC